MYLNVYQYVTWALGNELNEDTSGIKNKSILWVNLMIKDVMFKWYGEILNTFKMGKYTYFIKQYTCGATV